MLVRRLQGEREGEGEIAVISRMSEGGDVGSGGRSAGRRRRRNSSISDVSDIKC